MAGNNNTAVATVNEQAAPPSAFEKAVMFGDISGLNERGRMEYVAKLCESLGLNPLGRAFEYINFGGGKLTCYLTAMGASQLRKLHNVSITKVEDQGIVNGFYRITVYGGMPNGRMDIEFGSVYALDKDGKPLVGLALENCRKKTFTQSKSRLTKSLVGLAGIPSEDEKDDYGKDWGATIAGSVVPDNTDPVTGEVTEPEEPIITQAQFDQIGNLWKILREQFGKTSPARGVIGKYSASKAEHEIAKLTDDLMALQARKAAHEADPVVPQNTEDQLDVAFPEIPMHVGTP